MTAYIVSARAFETGLSGPIGALIATESIYATVITAVVFMTMPNYMEIMGLLFGVLGAVLISLGPQVSEWVWGKQPEG